MTMEELLVVRELTAQIVRLEKKINGLILLLTNVAPVLDGMPKATRIESKIETLALKKIEAEYELAELRATLDDAKLGLTEKILDEITDPTLQTLAILHYVECLPLKRLPARMHFRLRTLYNLKRKLCTPLARPCTLDAKRESE